MLAITNGEVGTDGEGATGSMARVLVSATSSEMACVQEGEGEGHDRETSDDTATALHPTFQYRELDEKKMKINELTSRLRQRVDDKNRAQDEWERLSYRLNASTPVRKGGV